MTSARRRPVTLASAPMHRNTAALHKLLLAWYRRRGRRLPWRDNDNPYHILVSEIMLQQTQVSRVLEKFPQWLRRFPTVGILASAPGILQLESGADGSGFGSLQSLQSAM